MSNFLVQDQREWNHTRIDNYIIDDCQHFDRPQEKLIYIVLCRYANYQTNNAWPSVKSISERAGCSERTAQSCLKRLEEMKLIKKQEIKGKPNVYILLPIPDYFKQPPAEKPKKTPAGAAPPQELHPTPAGAAGVPPQELRTTPAGAAPELYKRTKEIELYKENYNTAAENNRGSAESQEITGDIFIFFDDNIKGLTPYYTERINSWIDDHSPELVLHVFKHSLDVTKSTDGTPLKLIEKIFKRCREKGIETVEQFIQAEQQHDEQKPAPGKSTRKEKTPEWFTDDYIQEQDKLYAEKQQQQAVKYGDLTPEQRKAYKAKLRAKLQGNDPDDPTPEQRKAQKAHLNAMLQGNNQEAIT
jgi:DnaD/phage-associated family protein